MLTQAPDINLSSWELAETIQLIKRETRKASQWQFREEYIDRGVLDPYYILKIRKPEHDTLDDLGEQQLFQGSRQEFSYVNRTVQSTQAYWSDVDANRLGERLDRFRDMYESNTLQPPGLKADLIEPKVAHQVFEKRRFVFEILSPFKNLTGIGPNMYALGLGAVCGTVYSPTGSPLDRATVELCTVEETLVRVTKDGGLFWFSKVPSGNYVVKVKDRGCVIEIIRRDEFGNIKGWLTDQDGYPVAYGDVNFVAPDREVFSTTSNDTGKFTTGPLPAFPVADSLLSNYPYIMQVPSFMFSLEKTVHVKDAVIGGILRDNRGTPLANTIVCLKQKGVKLAEAETDYVGNFRFFDLAGGTYEIEVPTHNIYLSRLPSGRVEGKLATSSVNEARVDLVAEGKVVATERLNHRKEFSFDHVVPGKFMVSTNLK
jgi:hypothetical protein